MVNHVVKPNSKAVDPMDPSLRGPRWPKCPRQRISIRGFTSMVQGVRKLSRRVVMGSRPSSQRFWAAWKRHVALEKRTFLGADFCWLFMMYPYLPWFILIRCCSCYMMFYDEMLLGMIESLLLRDLLKLCTRWGIWSLHCTSRSQNQAGGVCGWTSCRRHLHFSS